MASGCPKSPPHVTAPTSLQTYVVKVQRDTEVTFVQRTFEEFQELHNKLRLLFPSSLLPRYPRSPSRPSGAPQNPTQEPSERPSPQLPQQVRHRALTGRGGGRAAQGGAQRLHLAPDPRCP